MTGARPGGPQVPITSHDREVIKGLATEVAEVAALPVQRETIALWKALNGLRPVRPMVAIDQIPWHEMDVDGELALLCVDEFCRTLETRLRRTLYAWRHMRADMVVEPVVDVPKVFTGLGSGIRIVERRATLDPGNPVVGHLYEDQLAREEDVEKIRTGTVELDASATAANEERAHDLLDDILEVRMQGIFPVFSPWDAIAQWRGAEAVLTDLAERPEHTHRIMARLTGSMLATLDQLEAKGFLGTGQATIHCTGSHADELPAQGYDPRTPRARDLWTCGMAQIFSGVSPAMHQEFEIDYAVRWYARFGLVYYGCCEPLDGKLDLVKKIPHVRKVSMSPWVNVERGAERMGKDLVFSRKPSPALVAVDSWDSGAVQADLEHTVRACRRNGTPVELVLKDISTVRYQPRRLWEWAEVARGVALG
jgi:hypothetical protein